MHLIPVFLSFPFLVEHFNLNHLLLPYTPSDSHFSLASESCAGGGGGGGGGGIVIFSKLQRN